MSVAPSDVVPMPKARSQQVDVESAVVRFTGDSGDGMQLTGTQFTNTAAIVGNDLATFPDFPAEIRAPAGTTFGVSGFQINFASKDIYTPGDAPDVLVAMNPAALKVNIQDLTPSPKRTSNGRDIRTIRSKTGRSRPIDCSRSTSRFRRRNRFARRAYRTRRSHARKTSGRSGWSTTSTTARSSTR
jgi:hypothetical protein